MKILMIAPYSGGIDVYVQYLSCELRKQGHQVDIMGGTHTQSAYDTKNKKWKSSKEVKNNIEKLTKQIPFSDYDLVAFHFGKNDVEQYIPVVIKKLKIHVPKTVYFVHFLSRNLFDQYLSDSKTKKDVENAVANFFDGYIFFGTYAKNFMEKQYKKRFSGEVVFLPETHSLEEVHSTKQILSKFSYSKDTPTVFLPGFAANYKDHKLLLESFKYVKSPLNFVIAGQGWLKRLGFNTKQFGNVKVTVVDEYLNPTEYKVLTNYSMFGVFPYRQPKVEGEYFQGSGTLPNFIYSGKASLVLDDGAMAEYIGKSGIVVEPENEIKFGESINELIEIKVRRKYEIEAKKRSKLFSINYHAQKCASYFNFLISPERE